jgi:hypothetical protein
LKKPDMWMNFEKKKNPPTYQPIGEMEGRVRETNIFLRGICPSFLCCRHSLVNIGITIYIKITTLSTIKSVELLSCTYNIKNPLKSRIYEQIAKYLTTDDSVVHNSNANDMHVTQDLNSFGEIV